MGSILKNDTPKPSPNSFTRSCVRIESVTFSVGGERLFGNLHLPYEGAPCIIMLHGLEENKDSDKWLTIAAKLYEEGYACLRFNFRGCGEGTERSGGKFEDTSLTARIEDYKAALRFLEDTKKVNLNRLGVIGSSFGGMVAIATKDKRIKAMVTLASPYKMSWTDKPINLGREGEYYMLPSGRRLKKSFYEDIKSYPLLNLIRNAPPLLIVHGDSDEIVPIEHAYMLYAAASEPKGIEIIENADHVFSKGLDKVIALSMKWFRKYLV